MATFLTTPQSISTGSLVASTWTNIASGAPAGSSGAIVLGYYSSGHSSTLAIQTPGIGASTPVTTGTIGSTRGLIFYTGVDASGNIGVYTGSTNGLSLYLIGYFNSTEAVFFGTSGAPYAVQKATPSTLTTSMANQSISGLTNSQTAIAAFLTVSAYGPAFQPNGSSDTVFADSNCTTTVSNFLVGLDGSQKFQGKAFTSGAQPYLVGYLLSGFSWNSTAINRTPGSTGTSNLGASTNALGALYQYSITGGTGSYLYTLDGQSSSGFTVSMAPNDTYNGQNVAVSPAQITLSNGPSPPYIYELGYFYNPVTYYPRIRKTRTVLTTFYPG